LKYRVLWTDAAISDLYGIIAYLVIHDRDAAIRMALKLHARAQSLEHYPLRGRGVRGNTRQSLVSPYLLRYRVRGDLVEIISIRHGARRPT
jgi:plasmid stabilization system protein ParE